VRIREIFVYYITIYITGVAYVDNLRIIGTLLEFDGPAVCNRD
jgi:hypothetical protein